MRHTQPGPAPARPKSSLVAGPDASGVEATFVAGAAAGEFEQP